MDRALLHEEQYRGEDAIAKLAESKLTLCGAGAVGSLLADNLVRQGFRQIRVIDCDRVEEHNVSTQLYDRADIGGWKAEILRNRLFRTCDVELEAITKRLDERSVKKLLSGTDVVIDAFDNSHSRKLVQDQCRTTETTALHVGLFEDYCEVIWDEHYRVPQDVEGDVCEYPLARNLVILAVAVASEVLVRFVLDGNCENLSATLRDFAIRPVEHD